MLVSLAASLLLALPALANNSGTTKDKYGGKTLVPTNYTVVPDIFIQDSASFNATGYDLLNDSFGLIDKSNDRWTNLTKYIEKLNKGADEHTTYKLVYLARHGEGYHNVAESFYGTPAWNCYWSLLNTDGNMTWGPDPLLTPKGISQAQSNNAGWKKQLESNIPLPQTLYSSPMRRSASTLNITWSDILLNNGTVPKIKENFRESIGLHTCDQRSNKSVIENTYPGWTFDSTFTFHDQLWNPTYEEVYNQTALRVRTQLNEIFATDPSTFISITAHSGVIRGFFTAIGHRSFSVQTGGFVPILIKAVDYPTATMPVLIGGQSATAPVCTANPTTKVSSPATATVKPTWYPNCSTSTTSTSTAPACQATSQS